MLDAGKDEEILRSKVDKVLARDRVEELKGAFVYTDLVVHLEEL